jgi:uncharacterized membrane protein YfcA
MEILVGFLIALAIAMSGVGAGTVTAPTLILFLGMPLGPAVGTALVFGFVVKIIAAPVYWYRKQVNFRTLGWMVLGGLPGVIAGSLLLSHAVVDRYQGLVFLILGITIIIAAGRSFFPKSRRADGQIKDRSRWLALVAAPIGLEVGFSSAGAGALGTTALMNMTPLTAAEVVGTDLFFGLVLSFVGGGVHLMTGQFDSAVILRLVIGGVVGAVVGANLASRMPSHWLRYALATWLVYLGGELFFKGWHTMGRALAAVPHPH